MAKPPLTTAEVLASEYVRLFGPEGLPAEPAPLLEADDILDVHGLASDLRRRLHGDLRDLLRDSMPGNLDAARRQLAELLNGRLARIDGPRWLFEDPAFADDLVPTPFRQLAADVTTDEGRIRLNRQMLDHVFGKELRTLADRHLQRLIAALHARKTAALAISGGGIRSATFALGVLQGLSRRRLLDQFHYLSTVSGGGYIGGWLSSWIRRDPFGIRGVSSQLTARPPKPLAPEPAPLRHLRAFSSYLTPRVGLLSGDTWTVAATYVRNLLLNWLILVPCLLVVVMVPRALAVGMRYRLDAAWVPYLGLAALALAATGLFRLVAARPLADPRNRFSIRDGTFLVRCLAPLAVAALLLHLRWAWSVGKTLDPGWIILLTVLVCLAAFLVFAFRLLRPDAFRRGVEDQVRTTKQLAAELRAAFVAGSAGGTLLWAVSLLYQTLDVSPRLDLNTALLATFGPPMLLAILFLQATIFVGMASTGNGELDREWWARAAGWVLAAAAAWIVIASTSIFGPLAFFALPVALPAVGGIAGAFSVIAGWSEKTPAKAAADAPRSRVSQVVKWAAGVAVPVFVLVVLALLSLAATALLPIPLHQQRSAEVRSRVAGAPILGEPSRDCSSEDLAWLDTFHCRPKTQKVERFEARFTRSQRSAWHLRSVNTTSPRTTLGVILSACLVAALAARLFGVNTFSMHAMYRNRLIRAYLGAAHWKRRPEPFSGFDPHDNFYLHELRPEYLWYYSFRDVEACVVKLLAPTTSQLQALQQALQRAVRDPSRFSRRLTRDFLERLRDRPRDPLFFQALNRVIARENLTDGPDDLLRPLRNRRFIEEALGENLVYPSPVPHLCDHDVVGTELDRDKAIRKLGDAGDAAATRNSSFGVLWKAAMGATAIERLNALITDAHLEKALPHLAVNASPFVAGGSVHFMIRNRLLLDALFAGSLRPLRPAPPLHLINACLNLTSGQDLAWQQRKGHTFTLSPVACGSHVLGYRDTAQYGEVSLGTAVAISGAAASPNMGYHSSPALAFLMTLFNVRLGWWMGNPGLAGTRSHEHRNPRFALMPLLREATGRANGNYPYVYLSDGGHFENLGLYELVQRRCHHIVISDAGADPDYAYDDLANAIRKVRVDLGIPIVVTHLGIIAPRDKKPGRYYALGRIDYAKVDPGEPDPGQFLYFKPVVYEGDVPRDVLNYARRFPPFPHEPTSDQFFTESQFESYRELGLHAIGQLAGRPGGTRRPTSIDTIFNTARRQLEPYALFRRRSRSTPQRSADSEG